MNLENLIESSPEGIARFLLQAKEMGYKSYAAENNSGISDAWTMAYGVGEEMYMLVYAVNAGEKKYPTKSAVRTAIGLKGRFDRKQLLEQGLANICSEMCSGEITPFLSEEFDASKLHVVIDQKCIDENTLVKFPAASGYFAMPIRHVMDVLQQLYGKDKATTQYLFIGE